MKLILLLSIILASNILPTSSNANAVDDVGCAYAGSDAKAVALMTQACIQAQTLKLQKEQEKKDRAEARSEARAEEIKANDDFSKDFYCKTYGRC